MIIRVLRPVTVKRGSSPGGEEPEAKEKPLADEAADANAIEVNAFFFLLKFLYLFLCMGERIRLIQSKNNADSSSSLPLTPVRV